MKVNGDVLIPKSKLSTYMSIVYVRYGRVVVELTDLDGSALVGEKISYHVYGGTTKTATTDEYGHVHINGLSSNVKLDLTYAGLSQYVRTTLSRDIQVNPSQTPTSITAGSLTFKRNHINSIAL